MKQKWLDELVAILIPALILAALLFLKSCES